MLKNKLRIPLGCFSISPSSDDEAAQKRRQLREKLLRGEEVIVTPDGQVEDKAKQDPANPGIVVPPGKLALTSSSAEDDAARKRRELREKLLNGEEVVVTQEGQIEDKEKQDPAKPNIVVPPGKLASQIIIPDGTLAANFYWYERDPKLLQEERDAMREFFPQFRLEKLNDGRYSWVGMLTPKEVRRNARWYLQAIYDHNHPHNNSYGGSVKVYSIEPTLEELVRQLGSNIPHTLRDASNHLYLCTARPEDVRVGQISTSAASSIAWAAKWITAFELWLAGEITTAEFAGHNI